MDGDFGFAGLLDDSAGGSLAEGHTGIARNDF